MSEIAHPAIPIAAHDPDASPAVFTRSANYADLAAVSVLCGLSADGLPVGVQLNVPGFHEIRALGIAATLQAEAGPIVCPPNRDRALVLADEIVRPERRFHRLEASAAAPSRGRRS